MYRITDGSTQNLSDVEAFIGTLSSIEARAFVDSNAEIFVARAPGRLDVMGGIADYSGSLALELPIREATLVALQRNESRELKIVSLSAEENNQARSFEMPPADFESDGKPISYEKARALFRREASQSWAAYVAGAFLVLMRERGVCFKQGARILIDSRVPEGKGVSSSAAIEVAVMNAVAAAFDVSIAPRQMALLCQIVENHVVGAPCGVMDQMAASCGEANQLLALLCQPAELEAMRRIPEEIAVWGIDSGIRHSVGSGDYGSVRTGAFMGYTIIAELAGLPIDETDVKGVVSIRDPNWRGYLANIAPSQFEQHYGPHLPERITGAEFLSRYKGITDPVTRVQKERSYSVLAPTAHPIYEHERVCRFAELLGAAQTEREFISLGDLMYGSHASYSACGLGSAGTDLLVELVRSAGYKQGLYGAKITGGGSGGTVAVLGRRGADASVEQVADEYERRMNYRPRIFSGSSPGAARFGYLKLQRGKLF
nr:gal_kin [uncultured bacterium]